MKKGRYLAKQSGIPKVPIAFLILLLIIGILLFLILSRESVTMTTPGGASYEETGPVEKNQGTISIPGYEGISLKANTRQQTVGLPNPAENNCYFLISLYLEDGTLLWQSKLVKPGEISDPIKLKQPLPEGYYHQAVLKYECFAMNDSLTPLNGAETKLTLRVK